METPLRYVERVNVALAPPQLKAFKRMRIVLEHVYYERITEAWSTPKLGRLPDKKTMQKFTGLQDLEIVLNPQFWEEPRARQYLVHLSNHFTPHFSHHSESMEWLKALPDLQLKSLRVTVEAEFSELGKYEKSNSFPTFTSRGETEVIKQWLRQAELDLHFGYNVVSRQEPVPFRVKQDDVAISIPPWATPEGLENFDLAKEEEARLTRMEGEEFHATWNAMTKEKDKEPFNSGIITAVDFHNVAAKSNGHASASGTGPEES